jgi:DNA-binding NtrC family response regulator
MSKILLSWYSFNHDFIVEQKGAKFRRLQMVNENGPTFTLHRYFGNEYEKHILLSNHGDQLEEEYFNLLVRELRNNFSDKIEPRHLKINDPISITEIFEKVSAFLLEFRYQEIEVFVNPGTPQMQITWYLVKPNFKKMITLFQLREIRFTQHKKEPERIFFDIDTIFNPSVFSIANDLSKKRADESKIFMTKSIEPVYEQAKQIARTNDVGCLILGESGTGKENLAYHIHKNSTEYIRIDANNKPFIAINCASLSDELSGSELFGHEKGAFTSSVRRKKGAFELANGGTIFLDEIGDISPKMQVMLLRALQEKKIWRVGGEDDIPIDVRIVAATNRDLEALCERGEFRWDLFFRLSAITLKLPPLRDWAKSEIKDLIEHFNNNYFDEFQHRNEKLKFSKEVIDYLTTYPFRGNIRELQNLFVFLYTFCNKEVTLSDLPERITKKVNSPVSKIENEKEHIKTIFERKNGNILQTANALGISRDTLKRKLENYGLRKKIMKPNK